MQGVGEIKSLLQPVQRCVDVLGPIHHDPLQVRERPESGDDLAPLQFVAASQNPFCLQHNRQRNEHPVFSEELNRATTLIGIILSEQP